ncbi:MAG: FAD-dependent oxidoreductase [Gordonibacter sp.]|uniref:FAD-dependent oxidoreductase n=1 Tax=Gordonibacter sp. TaxID=1968902 RepID=UPI002FC7F8AC
MKKDFADKGLSRRAFLGLGATAAVAAGAAGLAGCAPAAKEEAKVGGGAAEGAAGGSTAGSPTEFVPSFLNAPAAVDESKVKETIDVDVCVVGLGLAGICALREAAEAGATTIGLEKSPDLGYRSGEFGTFGSQIHQQLGIEQPEPQEVVNELMRVMGNRPNARLLNYWIANSGKDLDWYIGSAEHELLKSDHDTPTDPEKPYVFPERCPVNENYDWRKENYPCFPGMVHLLPDHGWAMRGTLEAAQAAGAEARFNVKGEQLIKQGDKVVGIYATAENGDVVRVNTKKGVILSCGDMSSDTEMLTYYAPQATKYACFFSTMDKDGKPVNTGDGHKMALWAGAVMEDGPYAPMTHSLGTNSIGIDPYLMVNQDGERFANEDVGAQELQNAIKRQKSGVSYQVFDSKWKEQLSVMPQCFGGVTHYVPPEQEAEYAHAINHFAAGYASDTYFQGEIKAGSILQADSIEKLAEAIKVPAATLKGTVVRYNELAHAGSDADFSKTPARLFPVETPPFYAAPFGDSGMLVLIGGIDCDVECRALNESKEPVEGLFVAGNTMGGRFLVDYPVTVAGASHSMAMSFGRLAGRCAAAGK